VVIDALFGFSFHGAPRPPFDALLGALGATAAGVPPVVSIDVPSGMKHHNPRMLMCARSHHVLRRRRRLGRGPRRRGRRRPEARHARLADGAEALRTRVYRAAPLPGGAPPSVCTVVVCVARASALLRVCAWGYAFRLCLMRARCRRSASPGSLRAARHRGAICAAPACVPGHGAVRAHAGRLTSSVAWRCLLSCMLAAACHRAVHPQK
jgi:hypothetical protein